MLMQLPPGAAIAISGPRSEKPTLVPTWRNPATAMTPTQLAGAPTECPVELPADATMTAPAALTAVTASAYEAGHAPSAPRLMLRTRAGLVLAGTPGTANPAA